MRRCIYCKRVEDEVMPQTCSASSDHLHFFQTVAARVEPVTPNHIKIALSPGYTAVSFKQPDGGAEVVILDKNITETTRLAVAPPADGQALRINNMRDAGYVEIIYEREK